MNVLFKSASRGFLHIATVLLDTYQTSVSPIKNIRTLRICVTSTCV